MLPDNRGFPQFSSPVVIKNDTVSNEIKNIPRWHFAMLNDIQRNQAFFDAIESTSFFDKTVLDIGTGTGLLAMLIARKGARHVYTCEVNSSIAAKAEEIIRANGLHKNITVINKLSTDLISGVDLPAEIDVMISETVDCGFLGEGFGYALLHAQNNLMKRSAELIPRAANLHACVLSSQDVANLNFVYDDIFGLDISAFNHFRTSGYFPVRLQTWPHRLVSDTVRFFSEVFEENPSFDRDEYLTFIANTNALAHGIVFWFDLCLKNDIYLSNAPQNTRSHWMQAVQLFDAPIYIQKGHEYKIELSINLDGVHFGKKLKPCLLENIAS
ncbi:50S ribosomal protein L11 methyltransferase [Chania multitudinisentens]|uniref:50S ribosomal protein L11 methyltransferase n=1 Tax=Chania multitudinisentens TaxID=1639108 RepID=UPI0003E14E1A|nr:50S ribosomal protein L11 methyltransferase [Chania multitudinisentens]